MSQKTSTCFVYWQIRFFQFSTQSFETQLVAWRVMINIIVKYIPKFRKDNSILTVINVRWFYYHYYTFPKENYSFWDILWYIWLNTANRKFDVCESLIHVNTKTIFMLTQKQTCHQEKDYKDAVMTAALSCHFLSTQVIFLTCVMAN